MHRATGLFLIALLLSAVFFLALPGTTAWQRVVQDAGHGPVFAGIAVVLLLMQGTPGVLPPSKNYWRALVIAVGLGAASELIQRWQPGRDVSLLDVAHDAAGAALGLALWALLRRSPERTIRRRSVLGAVALGTLVLLAWEPLRCATAYAERSRAFPVLLQGTGSASLYFARGHDSRLGREEIPAAWRKAGDGKAVRLTCRGGTRPALELLEPAPDWRGYHTLNLDLVNPGDRPLKFVLRVLDAHHDWTDEDRFNKPVRVAPASRVTLQVPLAAVEAAPARRRMDMTAISNVMLFSGAPLMGTGFYVARIWLQ